MLFNSAAFAVFFPTVVFVYFILPFRFRWAHLLIASCIFYMWLIPKYILVLGTTIVVDYFSAIFIDKSEGRKRKLLLFLNIFATCSILFVFKYINFFSSIVSDLAALLDLNYSPKLIHLAVPIGLSFHTLQGMSYVIEVYRSRQKAERHFGIFALYIMFFPQLVAGPVERASHLIPQLKEKHSFDCTHLSMGLKLMAWGFFKKVVISDRLASFINPVFAEPHGLDGSVLLLAAYFFGFQLYCDFSGYSDIARGAARIMGIRLSKNFDAPFWVTSPTEYWRRWHISVTNWFRDYFYLSLGTIRQPKWRWQLNLILTLIALGLWHGGGWNFALFGLIHGFYLVVSTYVVPLYRRAVVHFGLTHHTRLLGFFSGLLFFFALAVPPTVFFRAKDVSTGWYILTHFFSNGRWLYLEPTWSILGVRAGLTMGSMAVSILSIIFLQTIDYSLRETQFVAYFNSRPSFVRWSAYYAFVLVILVLGVFGETPFIYFQF